MSDLLDEAKTEYLHYKRVEFFKKLLPNIALITLAVIIVIMLKNFYQGRENAKKELRTSIFLSSLFKELKDQELEKQGLASLKDHDVIGDLATLASITSQIKDNKLENIEAELENIISNASSPITSSLAKLLFVGRMLDKDKLSEDDSKKIQKYIMTFDKKQPLYFNSQIYYALYNIKIGNLNSANDILKNLKENDLSTGLKNQIDVILNFIKGKK